MSKRQNFRAIDPSGFAHYLRTSSPVECCAFVPATYPKGHWYPHWYFGQNMLTGYERSRMTAEEAAEYNTRDGWFKQISEIERRHGVCPILAEAEVVPWLEGTKPRGKGTPKRTATLPDGTVVTRRTDRDYTHVIACEHDDGSWHACAWTTKPDQALAAWRRGRYNQRRHFHACKVDPIK